MIIRLLRLLRDDFTSPGLRGNLVRTTIANGAIKFGSLGLAFVASLLYARALGPAEYGRYAYVLAWSAMLSIPASLGLPQYLVREGAKSPGQWRDLRRWADRRVFIAGIVCGALFLPLSLLPGQSGVAFLMLVSMPLPILNALTSVRSGLLQAREQVIASQWPNLLLAPALILAVLFVLWHWSGKLSAETLVLATVAAAFVPFIINSLQLASDSLYAKNDNAVTVHLKAALPFMWLNALFLINSRTDLIMVGALRGAHDAGIYSVASRAAELVPFFLVVTNATIGPRIAAMHHAREQERLQRLATGTARRLLFATLPIACVMLFGAHYMIKLFYGAKFAGAAVVLQVLAVGQLITILGGPVGILLNMTEHASLSAKAFAVSAFLNLLLNALLVPCLGALGAAMSTAFSLGACTVIRWRAVRRHLGIHPSALGI